MTWKKQSTSTEINNETNLTSTVFKGTVDFASTYFRIPFLCVTKFGTIIAGSDIRYSGSGDFSGQIDTGIARSVDGGKTWMNKQVVVTSNKINSKSRAMDSTIIYDEVRNKIYIFTVKLDEEIEPSWTVISDKSKWDLVYVTSTDDGVTWSSETSIKGVINPFADRKIFLGGVGNGIVMENGTIVLPVQCSMNSGSYTVQSGIVYSTNGGVTWQMSQSLVPEYTSECNVVEYEQGKLLINARNDRDDKRSLYYTTDMGITWIPNNSNSTTSPERLVQLWGCMGSTIKITLPNGKEKILYSAPHNIPVNGDDRANISIMFSSNRGESWELSSSVYKQNSNGYSCLAYRNNQLYILLEIGGDIIFKNISHLLPHISKDEKIWGLDDKGVFRETPPTSSTSIGNKGDWSADSNYFYMCFADNSWIRISKDTWV